MSTTISAVSFGDIGNTSGFAGSTWVITGTLSEPRPHFEELIRRHGGKTSGSVSKSTTYLLAGEEAGSKLTKAQQLGVKVVSESEFRVMLEAVPAADSSLPQGQLDLL